MCRPKPGPRCATHAATEFRKARDRVAAATAAAAEADPDGQAAAQAALKDARKALAAASLDLDATPTGQQGLAAAVEVARERGDEALLAAALARQERALAHRATQEASEAAAVMTTVAVAADSTLDLAQSRSIWRKEFDRTKDLVKGPTVQEWNAYLDERKAALLLSDSVDPALQDEALRAMERLRQTPPDARTFAAMKEMPERLRKAESALRRQREGAAALRGAPVRAVEERFAAFRAQYEADYAHLPAGQRPDPPKEWVEGYGKKDMMAVSSPQDRATLYAMYRCQADPEAFPDNPHQRFASIDLETAGPSGKDGFDPQQGAIIEAAIVEYDRDGRQVGSYSQLIHPGREVMARCGTGAVDVHQITPEDVKDAPGWAEVAPQVARRLDGRVLLAQNARFEKDWLGHHLPAQGEEFDRYGLHVDTMTIARQHWPSMRTHRLSALCERVGVPYTNGHRAEHDAVAAGQAFFKMREAIFAEYRANPVRANAPQPAPGAGRNRRLATRLRSGAFDPRRVSDAWSSAPAA